ncbi:MAG: uroporphyrinogen decarboxylase [Candidatus Aminicenantes bacterium]|nr:uroporphyrinogen decarboxylase [Candidatus Aminicenantes bacterium]
MNGFQRISAALRGEKPDRVPVMLHNFLMAAREAGYSQSRFRSDPNAVARSFIKAVETYGYDGILVDVDTVTLAEAVSVRVDHPEDQPARWAGPALSSLEAVEDLPPPDVGRHPRVQVWLEAVRRLKSYFGGEVFVRGNCDQAPFSLAGMMRGPADWMMDLLDDRRHDAAMALLEYCAAAGVEFIRLMAGAGADMVSNGDSPAGPSCISPSLYRRFAQPFERRLADEAHALGLPYALHVCGQTDLILEDMLATGADALELDHKTDSRKAHAAMKDKAVFIGNIDPSAVLALGSPEEVAAKTRELIAVFFGTSGFILNAGCAIPAETPPANLRAMISAAK